MHILQLNDGVAEDCVGGARVYAREVAQALIRRGHEVTFLVPCGAKGTPEEKRVNGYRIIRLPWGRPIAYQRALQEAARRILREERVDGVFDHFGYTSWGYHRLREARATPIVRIFHGPWDREAIAEGAANGLRGAAMRLLRYEADRHSLQRSQRVVTLSRFMAADVTGRFRQSPSKVSVIPGAVDLSAFPASDRAASRAQLGIASDAFLVLSVRRLVKRMGLELLIDAAARVRVQLPGLQVVIGGKGPLEQELNQRIRGLGLDDCVRLLGFIPQEDLTHWYHAADVTVLPSIALEGFGLVALDSFACNTPVLGTPVGGLPEVIREFDPSLVLPEVSISAIAEGILNQARKVPQAGNDRFRQIVEDRYGWDLVADRLLLELDRCRETIGQVVAHRSRGTSL